jgi:hypothetical protein
MRKLTFNHSFSSAPAPHGRVSRNSWTTWLRKTLAKLVRAPIITLLCFMIPAIAGGCGTPGPTFSKKPLENRHMQEGREYQKDRGISIIPPKGWAKDDKAPARFLPAFIGPEADGFATLNVDTAERPENIEQESAKLKTSLAALQKEWVCIDDGPVEIDNEKAYYLCSRFVFKSGERSIPVWNLQYLVPSRDKKRAFVVTFTASAEKFEALRAKFEESAQSIRVD